ncbi:MAG TPA: chemotaxis protein CheW [Gemmatimonadaceae bacterium]|nr:chemotaxis protein CheW [Gemmatimonadaceae bacterium]
MEELLHDFLTESNENLQQLDRDIVALEQHPDDSELVNRIFRTIHTIKGTCGFIGLDRLEAVAHAAESVLNAVREGELRVDRALVSDVLAAVDVIKHILDVLERTQREPAGDDTALVARLETWLGGGAPDVMVPDTAPDVHLEHRSAVGDSTLRVHVGLLDKLMTLVGELVLDRNRLVQITGGRDDPALTSTVQHLNRVSSDLQEAVMRTRMQPIGGAWTKLPRLVRDLGASSGKQIQLEMHGAETELDRQILQAITDPLTHMVRNSGDHGIESGDVRRRAGKADAGTIRLNAYHEGGHVIIEVRDDGAGISAARVRNKAIDRGLVTREAADAMSDAQVLRFIFEPGFSTAERVTNVSGRGVGMDVVRTNIERIGGQVELQSTEGQGTVVRVKIPLTLAIIPALVVTSGRQRYAIPQVNLLELVRLSDAPGSQGVELLHGAPVYRLRGSLLPLVFLGEQLGETADESRAQFNIVVLQADGRTFGLVVDGLSDTEEIVVKPLGRHLQGLDAFSGATIMGDGSVALILDVPGLARKSRVADDGHARETVQREARGAGDAGDVRSLLVVQCGARGRLAVELASVNRLEEFRRDAVEYAGERMVAQYRGDVIPLVALSVHLGHASALPDRERLPVVVHTRSGRTVGVLVDRIIDIVDQEIVVHQTRPRPGILGTTVIQGRVTDLLDLDGIVAGHLAGDDAETEAAA